MAPYMELARVATAGSGFLADAYDLYIIGQVQTVLFDVYPPETKEDEASLKSTLSTAALVGAICGQLIFGYLADRLGRKRIFVITGTTIVLGSLISCSAWSSTADAHQVYRIIAFGRLVLGFGIGGEYPLSATIVSESCNARRRGTLMACVFSMQGVGYLMSASLMLLLTHICSNEWTWRIALGWGGVVPCISLYFRVTMQETKAFQGVAQARLENASRVDQRRSASRYKYHILGTSLTWALFDVVFYGNSLFNGDVTSVLNRGHSLRETMMNTFIIVLIQLPGYAVGVLTINSVGRKNMQLLGFTMMALLFFIIGLNYESLKQSTWLFMTMYGLTFFFSDFGPNMSTFIIPGEIFPPQIKATSHGLSAAAGKVGAVVGTSCFGFLQPNSPTGIRNAMLACSCVSVAGLVATFFFTPRYRAEDLDDIRDGETVGYVPLFWQKHGLLVSDGDAQ